MVPRTFVGALATSLPLKLLLRYFPHEDDKFIIQSLARGFLGMANALALSYFKNAIDWTCVRVGNDDKPKNATDLPSYHVRWFWAFLIAGFHLPFYASRTLPNFFAFPLTTVALALVLETSYESGLALLAFTAIVFRAELALLLATLGLTLLFYRRVSVGELVKNVAIGGAIGAVLSLAVDSYFWQSPLMIPEIKGFLFNVVGGKSSEWGVEPWSAYFLVHLPKLLGSVAQPTGWFVLFGLVPIGFLKDPTGKWNNVRILGIASLLFVTIYSFQPHKEWRFIVYVVPVFALLAANAVVYVSSLLKKRGEVLKVAFQMAVVTLIAVIGGMSLVKLVASSFNYPGGVALAQFHNHVPYLPTTGEPVVVHLDVPVCMTGASRFGQLYDQKSTTAPWVVYDKTEDAETLEEISDSFDYLITALPPSEVDGVYPTPENMGWSLLETVQSFERINKQELKKLVLTIKEDPKDFYVKALEDEEDTFLVDWAFRVVELKDAVYIYKRTQEYPWADI